MKTKNVIILVTFLLSGIFVSAQSYSDSNKHKSETTKNEFQASENSASPYFITSFGTWYQQLKNKFVSGTKGDVIMNPGDGIETRRHQTQGQPVEDYPGDPGPRRYFQMDTKEDFSSN